jgi:NADP-dependent 3-hydroxy acid dehydrogenase YdfG
MTERHIALITGAASGIGRAIAQRINAAGHATILVDKDESGLKSLGREFDEALKISGDLEDKAFIANLPMRLPSDWQNVEILVNAAGHDPGGTTRFDRGTSANWDSAIETNLLGTMRMTHAFLPGMIARNRGDIVNIGSIAGLRIVPEMTAYTTSKVAIHGFTESLRAELADTGIRVIEVMPGLTQTDLIRRRYGGDVERAAAYYERFELALQPEDIARSVMHALEAPADVVVAQIVVLPRNRW